jgi:VIT1/CCC1 family predicted Fe2+/Mn2+ transporter
MQHIEQHFSGSETVRDVVIGMADGLTVPFALAAGISGALTSSHIVVTAGLAEVAAGSIAMGLGGYLAAQSDTEHFYNEQRREELEIVEKTDVEKQEIVDIFEDYGVTADECAPILTALQRKPEAWRDFMMRFELGLEEPDPKRAVRSALTIGSSYVIGGLVPLLPYMLVNDSGRALTLSAVITLLALLAFGFVKGHFTGVPKAKSAAQTALVGSLAAAVAYLIAKSIA